MALLSAQTISHTGLVATYAAAGATGDTFTNDGRTFLHVINANVSTARTVTVNSLVACSQGVDHDVVVSVAASTDAMIGPFSQDRFNTSGGVASVSYSSNTDLTIAAIKLSL